MGICGCSPQSRESKEVPLTSLFPLLKAHGNMQGGGKDKYYTGTLDAWQKIYRDEGRKVCPWPRAPPRHLPTHPLMPLGTILIQLSSSCLSKYNCASFRYIFRLERHHSYVPNSDDIQLLRLTMLT